MITTCVVLAGGLGTRLLSAVSDVPKCLAPIAGRPFLEWQLKSLSQRGIDRFILSLGHRAELVLEALMQPWARSLSIDTVVERELLGTGGATLFAMNEFGLNEALVANGDTFLGGSLQGMFIPLDLRDGEFMRVATVQVVDRTRFGGIVVDEKGRVSHFLEKGSSGPGPINAGLYRVHRCAFEGEVQEPFAIETQTMPRLVAKQVMKSVSLDGPFIDIGLPDQYHLFDRCVNDYVMQI